MTSRFLLRYHRSQHHVTIVTIQGRCRRLNFRFVFLSKVFFYDDGPLDRRNHTLQHDISFFMILNHMFTRLTFWSLNPYSGHDFSSQSMLLCQQLQYTVRSRYVKVQTEQFICSSMCHVSMKIFVLYQKLHFIYYN